VATFGLIHGAYHGMWQWGPLVADLERRGQRGVCVNLPIDDPDRGVPDYAAAAAQAFEGIDDLVVVGQDWQRAVAIETLRVRPYELPGGHSPFLSRPDELAELLMRVAGDLARD
jgi:hypothetical protein